MKTEVIRRRIWHLGLIVTLLGGFAADWLHPAPVLAGDCNIHWTQVLHDTFDPDYRSPDGPVTPGTTVKLRLRVEQGDINSARVRVWNDGTDTATYHDMTWDGTFDNDTTTYDWWYVDISVGVAPTILYYFFELNDNVSCSPADQDFYVDDDPKFYGGGHGTMSDSYDDSRSFQLTVYDPAFTVPDWIQTGVVYQVFPDRFRDGDPSNNPPAGRFSYNTNGGTIVRSDDAEGDWNTTICDPRVVGTDCTNKYGDNFYGGDLAGITEKIHAGYFDALGVSILYLNPIFLSPSNHKYDTADFMKIDPDFGTLTDFQTLIAAAHTHNIKVILDGVFNHTSSDSPYFDLFKRYDADGNLVYTNTTGTGTDDNSGACESPNSAYRSWYYLPDTGIPPNAPTDRCDSNDSDDTGGAWTTTYKTWWGYGSLPKLQANSSPVRQLIFSNTLSSVGPYWIHQGASGWRFDVGDDIDPGRTVDPSNDYWESFRAAVRDDAVTGISDTLMLGEVWGDASPFLLGNEWDSVMNYRFRSTVFGWLFTGCADGDGCTGNTAFEDNDSNSASSSGSISQLSPSQFNARLRSIEEDYPPMAFKAMMNLAGSHDTNRVRYLLKKINNDSDNAALQRMKEWWLFAFTYAGAPTLYYGDEIALSHDAVWGDSKWQDDPYNRAPYPWPDTTGSSYAPVTSTLAFARKMSSIRWSYSALQSGDVQHGLVISDTDQVYGFGRTLTTTTTTTAALILLNRDASQHTVTLNNLTAAPYNLNNGTVLYDAIEGHEYTVTDDRVSVPVNATWGVALLDKAKIDTPIAPTPTITRDAGGVHLSWTPINTDTTSKRELVTSYEIHRSPNATFTPSAGTRIATLTPPHFGSVDGRIHYTDTVAADGGYFYSVRALNAAGNYNDAPAAGPTIVAQMNGTWHTDATWGGTVPTTSDSVFLDTGISITLTGTGAGYRLTLTHGATLFISGSLNISTRVVNSGTLHQRHTLNNNSASFLNIGDYRGVDITTTHNLGTVTVTLRIPATGETCTNDAGSPTYAARCFRIEAHNSAAATVRLWARTVELNGVTTPRVFRNPGGTATWNALTDNPSTGIQGDYTYAQGDTPGFSHFLIGTSENGPTAVKATPLTAHSGLALAVLVGSALASLGLWRKRQDANSALPSP